MSNPKFIIFCLLILSIPVLMGSGIILHHAIMNNISIAFAQGTPTAVIQGSGTGNLEFKEQEAYIVTELPEGVLQQNSQMGTGNELTNMVLGIASSTGVMGILNGLYTKMKGKEVQQKAYAEVEKVEQKTQQVKETTQQVAENQVKLATVQKSSLELQYENMPDKGNTITNKDDIKLANVEKIKQEALKTTAKA